MSPAAQSQCGRELRAVIAAGGMLSAAALIHSRLPGRNASATRSPPMTIHESSCSRSSVRVVSAMPAPSDLPVSRWGSYIAMRYCQSSSQSPFRFYSLRASTNPKHCNVVQRPADAASAGGRGRRACRCSCREALGLSAREFVGRSASPGGEERSPGPQHPAGNITLKFGVC